MAMPNDDHQEPPEPIILGAALRYASRGLRVIPIHPGTKRPVGDNWPERASNDPDVIRRWWKQNPDYGVGICTGWYGDRCIFVIDVDDGTDPKTGRIKQGSESLADLEQIVGPLPDTVEGQSGGGGRHIFLWSPVEIRNDQAGRLGLDLDLRGVGGQVVAHPTIHPDSGRPYCWIDGRDPDDFRIARSPAKLDELLTAEPVAEPRAERTPYEGPPRPGDRFAAAVTWPELLHGDGATFLGNRRDKTGGVYELWARPGEDHTSATLYYGGTDVLKVFTSNWPGLQQDKTYTRFGYWTATRHNGNHSAAAAALARAQFEDDIRRLVADTPPAPPPGDEAGEAAEEPQGGHERLTTWTPVDLAEVVAGGLQRPTPTLLQRTDGKALIYRGKINSLFGPSGSGKTWVAFQAIAEQIRKGEHAVYLDFEDDAVTFLYRLAALGVPYAVTVSNATYYSPVEPADEQALAELDQLIADRDTQVVVIDSTGEAMAADGGDQNADKDVASWMRKLPRRVARVGPGVILLDHVPKSTEGPKQEIGSQRKKAAIDGASYEVLQTKPFAAGVAGQIVLRVGKDRGGNYPARATVAEIAVTPNDDGTAVGLEVRLPVGRDEHGQVIRPTHAMQHVSEWLEEQPDREAVKRAVVKGVEGNNAVVELALQVLVDEGFVETFERTQRGGTALVHRLVTPFSDLEDLCG